MEREGGGARLDHFCSVDLAETRPFSYEYLYCLQRVQIPICGRYSSATVNIRVANIDQHPSTSINSRPPRLKMVMFRRHGDTSETFSEALAARHTAENSETK